MKKLLVLAVAAICGLLALMFAGALAATGTSTSPIAGNGPSRAAAADIPTQLIPTYQGAALTCPGLPWTVLAAIGKIESDHSRSRAVGVASGENHAGAGGPMQFLSSTWAAYGVDGDRDGVISRYSPPDAIFGAARYLCANGAGQPSGLASAIFAYNHADWYVRQVLRQAQAYGQPAVTGDASTLLSNPRLSLSPNARTDLAAGIVDRRLVALLAALLTRHTLYVGVFKTGHPMMIVTDSGLGSTVSAHYSGRGADIMMVDGAPVTSGNRAARGVVIELQALAAGVPAEIGQPWADLVRDGTFTNAVHQDHIHLGLLTTTR
ncbi:MAG TPA: lytic transglycosylase domain-containing protein [Nonomuraea sp.]|nr:lytic transglycosylase domain-containing protein [Nonomuraea sp.]